MPSNNCSDTLKVNRIGRFRYTRSSLVAISTRMIRTLSRVLLPEREALGYFDNPASIGHFKGFCTKSGLPVLVGEPIPLPALIIFLFVELLAGAPHHFAGFGNMVEV